MVAKKRQIEDYCVKDLPSGWHCMNNTFQIHGLVVFMNLQGIQLTVSLRDYSSLQVIHASLTPLHSVNPNMTVEAVYERTAEILNEFFPGKTFLRQPDDEKAPETKHYFYILKANE